MDFIGHYEKLAYRNTYICILVDYFSRYMYLHFIPGVDENDIILLFDYYLWFNYKPCTVYIDANTYFTI